LEQNISKENKEGSAHHRKKKDIRGGKREVITAAQKGNRGESSLCMFWGGKTARLPKRRLAGEIKGSGKEIPGRKASSAGTKKKKKRKPRKKKKKTFQKKKNNNTKPS